MKIDVLETMLADRVDAQQYRGMFLPNRLERGKVESQNARDAVAFLIEKAHAASWFMDVYHGESDEAKGLRDALAQIGEEP